MRTFEEYEKIATEAKLFLYNLLVKLAEFKRDNSEYVNMGEVNFYIWQTQQERLIQEGASHRKLYLEYWSKGDFSNCDYHYERF